MNVTAVKPNPKNDAQGFVVFDNGTEAWTPERSKAELLIGKAFPSNWTLKLDGPYGPQAFPPKEGKGFGGGASAYRNSKEGQFYEQERMDRRTALMQAVAFSPDSSGEDMLLFADDFYNWLRQSSGAAVIPPKDTAVTPAISAAASDPSSPSGQSRPRSGAPPPASGADEPKRAGGASSAEGHIQSGDLPGSPSTSTTTAEDRGQVVDKTTLAYGEGVSESDSATCPPHSPDENADKRAGRFPCLSCGLYVKGTMG